MPRRERKVVTALFADLAGFTSRSETMDPEDVAAFLTPYHSRLKSELEHFGGTVEKFIGDAVVAIFGAPVSHEDDAERAVRAAIEIRTWAADEGVELRVGINTGEALVNLDASPAEGEGIAAGDVVNTASRLQSNAPIGEILVGEHTYHSTQKAIEYQEAEPVMAKGKAQPVPAWRVVSARARVNVERVHGATLVGRRRELDLLEGSLERARQEPSCQLVTLIGVPGIGKSRLVLELYGRIEREEELTSWRNGRCLPYGEGITFWALGEMVKAQAGILEDDDEAETEKKLHAAVDDPWIEAHLRPLVGLTGGSDGGGDRRDEAFTAWRRWFEGLAEQRPLVLAFDDIHWADDNLLDFIDHLVDWAVGVPLLVVCTARSELLTRRPGWGGGKPNATTLSLAPLTDEETTSLLRELLEQAFIQGEQQLDLLARAGGNPLYAEEYVRMLRERGRVEQLPETVQGMIAARLDLLAPAEKSLVQDAAVVGKTFWLGTLLALSPDERRMVEERLHALERKEFVRRERTSSVATEVEYSFRHVLFRDVAYGQIPRAERAEKHLRTAEWIEALGRPEDHAEMLAHHYLEALELGAAAGLDTGAFTDNALRAFEDAGDRALGLNALDVAARYYRAAIQLVAADDPRRGRLLLRLGRTLWLLGEPSQETLESARDALLGVGDVEGVAEAGIRLAEACWEAAERDAAFSHVERARELLDPMPVSSVKARVTAQASRLSMLAGNEEEAIRFGREAIAMAEALGLDELKAAALNNVGTAKCDSGDESGMDDLAEAIRIAAGTTASWELIRAKNNLSTIFWVRGRTREARDAHNEARDDASRFGQLAFQRWLNCVQVRYDVHFGEWDRAMAEADELIADFAAGKPHYLASQVYADRGQIRVARGDLAGAHDDAQQALTYARGAADPQALLPALANVALIESATGYDQAVPDLVDEFIDTFPPGPRFGAEIGLGHRIAWLVALGRAEEFIERIRLMDTPWATAAIAIAEGDPVRGASILAEMGDVADEAYARLQAGKALSAAGRLDEAEEQLRKAQAFYRSVDASHYLAQIDSLLGARGVSESPS
jgi:class 3 adenylate cyclase/tetratricopeptide (TPR) repeat protein